MKKILLFLLCCVSTWCNAQTWLKYDASSSVDSKSPQRVVEEVADGVIVTYTFPGATIRQDDLYTSSYNWEIEGFSPNSTVAQPAYLQHVDQIQIPDGESATVTLLSTSYIDYKYELAPARPSLQENAGAYSKNNVLPIATYSGFMPKSSIAVNGIVKYRGSSIQKVSVCPIRYNMQTKTVRAYKEIKYKVTFSNNSSSLSKASRNSANRNSNYIRNTTINRNSDGTRTGSSKYTPKLSYLILTTDRYKKAAEKFAKWKRLLGFKTFVEASSSWDTISVRKTIESYYKSKSIDYLLIIGDAEDVPAEYSSSYQFTYYEYNASTKKREKKVEYLSTLTDYNYCCMDGEGDKTADISRGRLSVMSEIQANIVVDKIINYEQNPVTDSDFYQKFLMAAYFQSDSLPYTIESRKFVSTSEAIIHHINNTSQTKKVPIREYYTKSNVSPYIYYNGTPMPKGLQRPYYSWAADGKTISDAINSKVFMYFYRGHGRLNCQSSVNFGISNVYGMLSNGENLPVVFSICCSTGRFSGKNCFAEALLRKPKGGAVAVLASHEVSYSGYNDYFSQGIIKSIWPKNNAEPVYRLGDIVDQGLAFMEQQYSDKSGIDHVNYTKNVFHLFGDPSMMLTTEVPTPFKSVKATCIDGKVTVTLAKGDEGQITLVDTTRNECIYTYYGNSCTFTLDNPKCQTLKLCVSGHNRIPYIKDVENKPVGRITDFSYDSEKKIVSLKYITRNIDKPALEIYGERYVFCVWNYDIPKAENATSYSIDVSFLPSGYSWDVKLVGDGTVFAVRTFTNDNELTTAEKSKITNITFDKGNKTLKIGYQLQYTSPTRIEIHNISSNVMEKSITVDGSIHNGSVIVDVSGYKTGPYAVVLYHNRVYADYKTTYVVNQ